MNKLIKMVRKVAASSRLLAAGLLTLSLTAQAADELTQLLVWQGQQCIGGKIKLTKSINISTDELIVEKDLEIDLNGFDLCVKSVGGVLKTYRGNVAIFNSKKVSGSSKVYFPYHIDAYTDAAGVTRSGSITVNEGVVFGPTCFGIIDNTSLIGWVESGKGLHFLAGAFFSDDFFISTRHCVGAFIFERGAHVCKAVHDAMLKGIGKSWAALKAKVSDILTNGFYIMLEDGEAKIEVTKAFTAWPWRDRLYVGYRVSGIMDHGVDYKVTLYCGAGTKMPLKELYSYKSDNGFEHLITSGHHEVQFDTDGVLGTGWGSFFPKNLNTTDTEVKAVLSMKENGVWVVVSESSLKGFLIDNRSNKVVKVGETYPVAYSGVGFFGLPGILTGVTYETHEWKQQPIYAYDIFKRKNVQIGSIPYLDIDLEKFHTAHIDVGTKNWMPDRCVTYHWQHQNGLEIYAATIRATDKIAHVPEGKILVYNGEMQQGVDNGAGYRLGGTVTAKYPGKYEVTAKLNSDYIWDDGLGDDKTITWYIVGASIEGKTATVPSCTYTGSALKPIPSISGLTYGKDFEVVGYENNVNAGVATVIIRGKGNYSGEIQATFTIDPKAITKLPATQEFTYDGQTHQPLAADALWTLGGTTSAKDVGSYSVRVTPTENGVWADAAPGQERATRTVEWKIVPSDFSAFINPDTFLSPKTFVYDGTPKTPTVTIATLKAGVDYDIAFEDNVNAGTAKVKITGKGNMAGRSYEGSFSITSRSISDATVELSETTMPVNGKPTVTVKYGGKTLVDGTDYAVTYTGYSKPGKATVTVSGLGNWTGEKDVEYTIQSKPLPDDKISLSETEFTYDGTPKTPAVNGLDGLTEGVDYTLNYKNNVAAGKNTATVTVVGIGEYSGTAVREFTIKPASISGKTATVNPATVTYNGKEQKPAVTISGLKEGVDFTVAYANNVNAGENTATVTVTGIGNYAESTSATFTIAPATLKGPLTLSPTSVPYDGTPKTVSVTVKDGDKTLVNGTDYTVAFSNNTEPGRATVTVTGKGNYTGSLEGNFTITQGTLTGKKVTVAEGPYVYDGNEKKPAVTIDGLTEGVDFTVAYANNVNAGTATVTITGIGKYTGTIDKTFTIGKKSVKAPTAKDAQGLVYDGTEQSGLGNLDDASDYTLTGVTKATEIGSYTATATLKDTTNTQWAGGSTAPRTISWQIKAATIDEDGVLTVKNQDQFDMGLPRFINEGTVTIRAAGFTPDLPDGYLWKTLGDGLYAVSRISGATTSFVLDTRTTRTLGAAEAAQALTHSATAWGEAADAGSATITFTRDGGDAVTLGTYADGAADAPWTAAADGTYVFTHQPSGLTATFVVTGMGPQGSGTAADPYIVYNEAEFAEAVARGKEVGQSPIYIKLGGDIAVTEPLAVADANVNLNMNGFDITAGDDGSGNGKHAMVITGTGSVAFTGTGTVKGGDGKKSGATAVEGNNYTKDATVTIVDGVAGLGTEDFPYIVKTRAEFEAVVKIGNDPVWVRLAANIPETVTIGENKKVICDLDGFSITGTNGTSGAPDGRPGIDVTGYSDLVLTNSHASAVGKVIGGNGANGNPPGNGGAGVAIAVGTVTVGKKVVVQGGNGGLATGGGADGKGAEGVTGTPYEPVEGEILPGKTGNGTKDHPYLVANNDDVAEAIAVGPSDTVYMRLVADFDDTLIVDNGTKGVNIDTFGHDVAGGKDEDGFGKPGVAVRGDGDIGFRNTAAEKSVVAGGDGTTGGAAVQLAKEGATYAVEPEAEIDFVDGKGLGDGSEQYPIEVRTVQELEDAYNNWPAESGTLHVRLIADLGFAGTLPGEPANTDHGVQVKLDSRALNLSLDLNGHDIVGGRAADGSGMAAIVIGDGVNAGMSCFTVTNGVPGVKGNIFGGNGIAGQDGGNGVAFAYTIDENNPMALVMNGASVIGGDGGNNKNGEAGKGAEGVNGKAATSEGGVIARGQDGKAGQGTKAHPFEIWSQADVVAAYAAADPARDFVYMKLMTNLVETITLDGGRGTMFYLDGHTITGPDGAAGDAETDGQDGQPALVISEGDEDISIFGEGALAGGNGGDDFYGVDGAAGKPGKGALAYVKNGTGSLAIGDDVIRTNGKDGRTGDGTAEHPYLVGTALEAEDAIAEGEDPVYIRLTADIDETILIDESKKVFVDLNGYDITGTEIPDGQGLPAVLVTGGGELTFENTSDEKSYVTGGDGKTGGEAVAGVTPKVVEGDEELVEFRKGLSGNGTEASPFEVANNAEIADALAKAAENGLTEPVYLRLTADFAEPISVDVTKSVVLDTNGHSADGRKDADGKGRPGLVTTGEGGTLELENTSLQPSVIRGGDGNPGAPATSADHPTVAAGEISFVDGLTRNPENNAYVVRDQAELDKAMEAATEDPVRIELAADFTNMVVTTDKELVIDLKGHDVVGGVNGVNGEAAITVNGEKPVTVIDTAEEKGQVIGGSGVSGEPAGSGASGIVAGGDVTVDKDVTVIGGNGGNSVTGTAGSGAPAVATTGKTAGDGTLIDGHDGTRGDGSADAPYVVSSADELEKLCNDPEVKADPLYIRLDNTIDRGVVLPGDRNIVLDLDGHNICGRNAGEPGWEGLDGEPAVTVSDGVGSLKIVDRNEDEKGALVGGDGANSPDPETEPGKGAEALAGKACEVQEDIAQKAGRDGRSGDGSKEHPFYVATADELEDVVNNFIPPIKDGELVMDVYVVVTNDLTRGVTLDGNVSPKIDLNRHSITGNADGFGNGVPAITFGPGDGEPEITGPGALIGGDATLPGGTGATWVKVSGQNAPVIADDVELIAGLNGKGTSESPYEVGSSEEFERALEKGNSPVYIKLVANIAETLEIGVNKDVVLDFNGYSVTGGVGDDGNGLPGLDVTGTGDLTLTGDGYVKGGKGADERDEKPAGNGGEGVRMGENAGTLTIADKKAFAIGGNGGNAETYGNPVGKGGAGVLPADTGVAGHSENVKAGEDGKGNVELLNEIFGAGNIEIDVTTSGVHRVVLTRDLTGPIQIPDSIGQLEIDMAGFDIIGKAGGAAQDGANGIEIIRTGNGNAEITLIGPGSVHGGNGGDSDTGVGGTGGIGLMTETDAIAVVNVGEGVDIQGGQGGNGRTRGGTGGTGATGTIGVNEGSIIGGKGGSGMSVSEGKAGDGGAGGDSLSGTIEEDLGYVKGGKGGDGGNSGGNVGDEPGCGGRGGDQESDETRGESGSTGMTGEGIKTTLENAFGGREIVDVTKNEDGVYVVTITNEIPSEVGTVVIPDSVGDLIIDLKGHDIVGPDGTSANPDGSPALLIESTGKCIAGSIVQIINSLAPQGGNVKGGNGYDASGTAKARGGDGAPAIMEEDDYPVAFKIDDGVVVRGGNGGDSKVAGGDGGAGIDGNVKVNEGAIYGGNGGSVKGGGVPGEGAKAVTNEQPYPEGVLVDGKNGKPTLTIVAVHGRFPWNGYIDIDYTIDGDVTGCDFEVSFRTHGIIGQFVTLNARTFLTEPDLTPGQHRVTWNAAKDFVLDHDYRGKVTVTVSAVPDGFRGTLPIGLTDSASLDVDFRRYRQGSKSNPIVIAKADDLSAITYSASDWVLGGAESTVTVVACDKDGKPLETLWTGTTGEDAFTWVPTELTTGLVKLTHTVGGETEEAWFQILSSAVGDRGYRLPVDFTKGDGKENQKFVPIGWDWLADQIPGFDRTKERRESITEKLREIAANGLELWQNAILGWSGTRDPNYNDISIDKKNNRATIVGLDLAKIASTLDGVNVCYVLKRLVDGEWVEVPGKVSDTPSFEIDLGHEDPTGYYRIYLRFEPTDKSFDEDVEEDGTEN